MGGARYFMSVIGDYSIKVWIILLKPKDEAFDSFKNWKTLLENQTGAKVKKLRPDNGLVFINEMFNNF